MTDLGVSCRCGVATPAATPQLPHSMVAPDISTKSCQTFSCSCIYAPYAAGDSSADRGEADRLHALAEFIGPHDLCDGAMQDRDAILAGVPVGALIPYQLCMSMSELRQQLLHPRHVTQLRNIGDTVGATHRQRAELALTNVRHRGRDHVEHHVDVARVEILERRTTAPIGHMGDVHAGGPLERFDRQMADRAGAGRPHGELARIPLGGGDQLVEASSMGGRNSRSAIPCRSRPASLVPDRGQGPAASSGGTGIYWRTRMEAEPSSTCMPILLGLGDDIGAEVTAGPAPVLHQDVLPEAGLEPLPQEPAGKVHRAARHKGHDDAYGTSWEGCGLRSRDRHGGKREGCCPQEGAAIAHDVLQQERVRSVLGWQQTDRFAFACSRWSSHHVNSRTCVQFDDYG